MSAPAGGAPVAEASRLTDPNYDPRAVWRPSKNGYTARYVVWAGIILFLIAAPHIVDGIKVNVYVTQAVVYGIVALSMNLLMGYTGQVSLGHGAFVGIGAFGAGLTLSSANLTMPFAMVVAVSLGALLALALGAVALRVKGLYFALVTIVFGVFCQQVLFNVGSLGGGVDAPRPSYIDTDVKYAYFAMLVLAVIWVFDWRLTSTKAGRAIQALRDDERVAASWGINVTQFKLLAFGLSGAIAGAAGGVLAMQSTIVSNQTYVFTLSLTFVLMTVFGGLGSRAGVVMGGFLYAGLEAALDSANQSPLWQVNDGWIQTVGPVPLPGPQLTQILVGAAVAFGGIMLIRTAAKGGPESTAFSRGGAGLFGALLAFVGLIRLALPAVSPGDDSLVLWTEISGSFIQVIGALLVIITLVTYPGGLAQLLKGPISWLSFKQFNSEESVTVGGGSAGGGMGARP